MKWAGGILAAMFAAVFTVTQARGNGVSAPTDVALSGVLAPGDTLRVIARWGESRDGNGAADSYLTLFTGSNGFRRERTTTFLADTAFIPQPALPDSLCVTVAVTAMRRGKASSPISASACFKRPDAPPPPPGPITIDTMTVVSTDFYMAMGGAVTSAINVGQVVDLCVVYHTASGLTGLIEPLQPDSGTAHYDNCRAAGIDRFNFTGPALSASGYVFAWPDSGGHYGPFQRKAVED